MARCELAFVIALCEPDLVAFEPAFWVVARLVDAPPQSLFVVWRLRGFESHLRPALNSALVRRKLGSAVLRRKIR